MVSMGGVSGISAQGARILTEVMRRQRHPFARQLAACERLPNR
jgi:hypothetical protein